PPSSPRAIAATTSISSTRARSTSRSTTNTCEPLVQATTSAKSHCFATCPARRRFARSARFGSWRSTASRFFRPWPTIGAAPMHPRLLWARVSVSRGHSARSGARAKGRLAAGAVTVDAFGVDLDDDALLAGTEIGVLVCAQVLLRKHVDVLECAFLDDLG